MLDEDPVSIWIEELKRGEDSAARKLWSHFMLRLHEAARARLRPKTRRVYDEEDAAQSVFQALCSGAATGRFPDLHDRVGLWRLLLTITSRKVANRHRHDCQERRDIRRTDTDSVLADGDQEGFSATLATDQQSPEFEAAFGELCEALFASLDEPQLERIGWLKIEGYSDQEIADQLKCSRRTVQRKVERIRRQWLEAEAESE